MSTTFEGGDYLGTNRVETNSSQTVSGIRLYDAFGNLESTTGTPAGPFGYAGQTGYQEDGDSGLKLLGERYYDPSTGRFLTRDHAMDGRTWYAYADENPLRWIDPNGESVSPWEAPGIAWLIQELEHIFSGHHHNKPAQPKQAPPAMVSPNGQVIPLQPGENYVPPGWGIIGAPPGSIKPGPGGGQTVTIPPNSDGGGGAGGSGKSGDGDDGDDDSGFIEK